MLDFMLKITLIWLRVGPPVGTAGDGAGDDVLVAIRSAGSELHKHRLVCLSPATIVVVLAMTQLHQKQNSLRRRESQPQRIWEGLPGSGNFVIGMKTLTN